MERSIAAVLALLAVAAGLAPVGSTQWGSWVYQQDPEPNTAPDTDPTYMWQTSNQAAVDKIYFDVIINHVASSPVVPWVQPAGTATHPYGTAFFHAYLGYWRDCNQDDFIGDALTGVDHYLVTPDVSAAICPATGLYNDGTYVQEFLSIGPEANQYDEGQITCPLDEDGAPTSDAVLCTRGSLNFVRDDFAKIWHDWWYPFMDAPPTTVLTPFPQGTLTDTNGHFMYVDRLTFGRLSGQNVAGKCNLGGQVGMPMCWMWPSKRTSTDPDGAGGLRARADPNQCAGHDTDGDGYTDDFVGNAMTALTTESCSPVPNVPDPVTATVRDRNNDSTTAAGSGPSGTTIIEPWEWCDSPSESMNDCRGDQNPNNDAVGAECEMRGDFGLSTLNTDGAIYPTTDHIYRSALAPELEGAPACSNDPAYQGPGLGNQEVHFEGTDTKLKADSGFAFVKDDYFNPSETGLVVDVELCSPVDSTLDEGQPHRCGGTWVGTANWLLIGESNGGYTGLDPRPFHGTRATFYADVNFASVFGTGRYDPPVGLAAGPGALPAGTDDAHTYGAEQCADSNSFSWSCDSALWIARSGQTTPEAIYLLPKVGDNYDLRDVECYDNDTPVGPTTDTSGPLSTLPPLFPLTPDCDTVPVIFPNV